MPSPVSFPWSTSLGNGCDQLLPGHVPSGDGPRSGEGFVGDGEIRNLGYLRPAPARQLAGAAFASDLIVEQAHHALEHAVVVRLGLAPAAVREESHQPLAGDGEAQLAVGAGSHWDWRGSRGRSSTAWRARRRSRAARRPD